MSRFTINQGVVEAFPSYNPSFKSVFQECIASEAITHILSYLILSDGPCQKMGYNGCHVVT